MPGSETKNGKTLKVPLSSLAVACLRQMIGQHQEYVFTYQGNPVNQVSTRAWRSALKRAGINDFRWHDLRHCWATDHVSSGTTLLALMKLGGWSDPKMVARYAHLTPSMCVADVNRVGQRQLPLREFF